MTPIQEVQQAQAAFLTALNQGDVAAILRLNQPGGDTFYLDNDLLFPDPDQTAWEGAFAAGLKYALQSRHEEIKVFGQCAVVTGYLVGTVTVPGGTVLRQTWRTTMVWVQTAGSWRNQHVHLSPLTPMHKSSGSSYQPD